MIGGLGAACGVAGLPRNSRIVWERLAIFLSKKRSSSECRLTFDQRIINKTARITMSPIIETPVPTSNALFVTNYSTSWMGSFRAGT